MHIKIISMTFLVLLTQLCLAESNIKFDWGKSKAVVTETINKNGSTLKLKYNIELLQKQDSSVLKQSFIKLISVNGVANTYPGRNRMVAGVASLPQFRLDAKGHMIEVINEAGFIKHYGNSNPDPNMKEMLEKPRFREMVLMQSYQKWCYWVCLWTGDGLSESNPVIDAEDVDFMGNQLPQTNTTKHHGELTGSPGLVKLTYLSVTGVNDPLEFVENAAKSLGFEVNPEPGEAIPSKLSKVVNVEAHTEPSTLKPHLVVVDIKTTMQSGSEAQEIDEKHVFEFEWK